MRYPLIFSAVLLETLALVSGCATRGSVRALEGQVQQHARRMDSESSRIDAVGQRVESFGQRVDDLDGRVGRLANHQHVANVVSTLDVRFPSGSADLDDAGLTRLHALVKELRDDNRAGLELIGYTDPRGSRDANVELSQRRVDAVRRYLVQKGVSISRIASVGLGPLAERGVPDSQKRRVTVNVTMPEVVSSVAPPARAADASDSTASPVKILQSN